MQCLLASGLMSRVKDISLSSAMNFSKISQEENFISFNLLVEKTKPGSSLLNLLMKEKEHMYLNSPGRTKCCFYHGAYHGYHEEPHVRQERIIYSSPLPPMAMRSFLSSMTQVV